MTVGQADTILLVGAGRMGGALLQGWLRQGVAGARITVLDPDTTVPLISLCRSNGISLNPATPSPIGTVLLAVKPQILATIAPGIEAWAGPDTSVVSILAGKTLANLASCFPRAAAIVRAMPNLPAAVGRGVTGLVCDGHLAPERAARVTLWLAAVGQVEWLVRERDIDIVTAISGSGPAYVFLLAEMLGHAAAKLGLDADLATRLGRATVEGAGELMFRTPDAGPSDLRQNVTSPGGTTAAALAVLMADDALQPLIDRAIDAAVQRASELAT